MLKAVTQGYTKHIQQVLSDRHIMTAMEEKVEQAMKNEHAEVPHIILQIDAMDKSKWMIPRDVENSKRLSALWRPSLHFVGVLVPGIMEYYGILEADVEGDSDTQQTILSRVLELVAEHLQSRGRKMASRLIIQSDNTSKEGRNSPMLTFASLLVKSNRFAEVSLTMFRVGHTHNRLDQRFGVIGAKLARAGPLQTPEAYVSYLQENYVPARGVELKIEVIHAVHHWREFVAPLNVHFSGIQGSKTTADAAHVMRVVRRENLQEAGPELLGLIQGGADGQDSDPILLAKHWLCSKTLSQPPTVLLTEFPLDFMSLVALEAPRTVLTEESVKKYQKTANEILEAPWSMHEAYAYLLKWMERNASGKQGELPHIDFVIFGPEKIVGQAALQAEEQTWKDFAPEGAIEIKAAVPKSRPSRRRAAEEPPQGAQESRGSKRARRAAAAAAAMAPALGPDEQPTDVEEPAEVEEPAQASLAAEVAPALADAVSLPALSDGENEPEPQEVLRRPAAAAAKAKAKTKAKAKAGNAKSKAKPAAAKKVAAAKKASGAFLHFGCSKCRYGKPGCPGRCQKFARQGLHGYSFDADGFVVRHSL